MTTIQLSEERRRQLARLKVGGLTYDDVLAHLLRGVDETAFRQSILDQEERMATKIRSDPENQQL